MSPPKTLVLMLEDEHDRVDRFVPVLQSLAPELELQVWDTASNMIRDLPDLLDRSRFLSLDHDLFTECGYDPGNGVDVARFLAQQAPVCPIVIHSSNSPRAYIMTGILELEGWEIHRSVPLGDNWIEEDWYYVVKDLLKAAK